MQQFLNRNSKLLDITLTFKGISALYGHQTETKLKLKIKIILNLFTACYLVLYLCKIDLILVLKIQNPILTIFKNVTQVLLSILSLGQFSFGLVAVQCTYTG